MKQHLPLALLLLLISAAPTSSPDQTTASGTSLKPYTEKIEGTLVQIEMVPIPSGKIDFSLDGKPPFKTIEIKSFWIAKTECTWDQYDTFYLQLDLPERQRRWLHGADAKTRPSSPYVNPDCDFGHAAHPAINLTAHAGKMYCQWLSKMTGRKYRLPTPAEWEYACRAGADEVRATDDTAFTSENSPNQSTQPVAKKKPNAFGLYDMLGNVGEWTITQDGKNEFLCGGHFLQSAKKITSATREPFNPAWQIRGQPNAPSKWWLSDGQIAGFRVVREE